LRAGPEREGAECGGCVKLPRRGKFGKGPHSARMAIGRVWRGQQSREALAGGGKKVRQSTD